MKPSHLIISKYSKLAWIVVLQASSVLRFEKTLPSSWEPLDVTKASKGLYLVTYFANIECIIIWKVSETLNVWSIIASPQVPGIRDFYYIATAYIYASVSLCLISSKIINPLP